MILSIYLNADQARALKKLERHENLSTSGTVQAAIAEKFCRMESRQPAQPKRRVKRVK